MQITFHEYLDCSLEFHHPYSNEEETERKIERRKKRKRKGGKEGGKGER